MQLPAPFIDAYTKIENYLREVRVGFPEGLKQHILAWFHDVGAWISAHYMSLCLLAVSLLGFVALERFLSTRKQLGKAELQINRLQLNSKLLGAENDAFLKDLQDLESQLSDKEAELVKKVEAYNNLVANYRKLAANQ